MCAITSYGGFASRYHHVEWVVDIDEETISITSFESGSTRIIQKEETDIWYEPEDCHRIGLRKGDKVEVKESPNFYPRYPRLYLRYASFRLGPENFLG